MNRKIEVVILIYINLINAVLSCLSFLDGYYGRSVAFGTMYFALSYVIMSKIFTNDLQD